jgi:hypothetical protein
MWVLYPGEKVNLEDDLIVDDLVAEVVVRVAEGFEHKFSCRELQSLVGPLNIFVVPGQD